MDFFFGSLSSAFLGAFIYTFTTLIPVINPFSGAMFFIALSNHLSDEDRAYVAGRICRFFADYPDRLSFCRTLNSWFFRNFCWRAALCGRHSALRMPAGLRSTRLRTKSRMPKSSKKLPRSRLKAMAFFPFTLPLTTGPGAIAVSVALGTSLPFNVANIAGTICATIVTVIVIWLCYRYSDRVKQKPSERRGPTHSLEFSHSF